MGHSVVAGIGRRHAEKKAGRHALGSSTKGVRTAWVEKKKRTGAGNEPEPAYVIFKNS